MYQIAQLGVLYNPILAVIICVNLVSILHKVRDNEDTSVNTIVISVCSAIILFSITALAE
ncbi:MULTISPECIES: hypothetical protein [unclassified Psychrobacillus]|uniref:hypothetical protein n=1 Tax=unclassified Psychrobacillus TaxID=2636677 RepID=UPI00146C76B1|nr:MULTISPECIES: hypothetical protein [unclassified Psychrobacillus]MCM3360198.1 hypothetical protein [Psychrobacillus sp. MER TA 171]NME04412.1 hypothetical protein [Psychrobacillus sp. BL-248-WT-3]